MSKTNAPEADKTVFVRNDSPRGDLDVPLLGVSVKRGAIVEVTSAQADILCRQAIWTKATKAAAAEAAKAAEASTGDNQPAEGESNGE